MIKKNKKTYKKNRVKNRLGCFVFLLIAIAVITFLIYLSQKFEINFSHKGKSKTTEEKVQKPAETEKETIKEKPKEEETKKEEEEKEKEKAISKVSVIEQVENTLKEKLFIEDYKLTKINNKEYRFNIKVNEEEQSIILVYSILKGAIELTEGKIEQTKESPKNNIIQMKILDEKQRIINIYLAYKETKAKKPKKIFAIIIDDFGNYKNAMLDKFMKLDKKVVFAIIPGLPYSKAVMQVAKDNKRKTIIHIPMQPLSYPKDDPGENAILIDMSSSKIKELMESYIKELPYCCGVNNHMGNMATIDEKTMKAVLEVLKEKNMFFIDSRTNSASIAYDIAKANMIPTSKRDIFLDVPDNSKSNIEDKIKYILNRESQTKFIIITHCFDEERLNSLKYFLKRMKEVGYTLVDIKDILD